MPITLVASVVLVVDGAVVDHVTTVIYDEAAVNTVICIIIYPKTRPYFTIVKIVQ